jgi:hypothetical protein
VDWKILPSIPKLPRIQRAKAGKSMKGRPITLEEFERMLDKIEAALVKMAVGGRKKTKAARISGSSAAKQWTSCENGERGVQRP